MFFAQYILRHSFQTERVDMETTSSDLIRPLVFQSHIAITTSTSDKWSQVVLASAVIKKQRTLLF